MAVFVKRSPYTGRRFRVSSPYGYRTDPFTGQQGEWHGGIDLVGIDSKEVVSVTRGRVLVSQWAASGRSAEWGNYVAILAESGEIVYYCHLDERYVSVGDFVKAGTVIGREGATGRVTGAHLHVEVRDRTNAQLDAAAFLGLPNAVGEAESAGSDYALQVAARCGFEQQTVDYLNAYEFSTELWRKLWLAMDGAE
ncbi:MAG: M23 family metallopeptidase [Ruminococcaceae bacterium]|nr:M23 family metallopeptidase [Oscillospiraceae bacterium]